MVDERQSPELAIGKDDFDVACAGDDRPGTMSKTMRMEHHWRRSERTTARETRPFMG